MLAPLLTRIITEVDNVVGVKQSAGDTKLLADLLLLLEGRGLVFSAVDALLYPSFALGADGAIAAILTRRKAVHGSVACSADQRPCDGSGVHEAIAHLNALLGDNLPANVKTAMRLQGRAGGVSAPMPASSPQQEAAIRVALEESRRWARPDPGVSDKA